VEDILIMGLIAANGKAIRGWCGTAIVFRATKASMMMRRWRSAFPGSPKNASSAKFDPTNGFQD
jgi:hypothetical protein